MGDNVVWITNRVFLDHRVDTYRAAACENQYAIISLSNTPVHCIFCECNALLHETGTWWSFNSMGK